MKIKDLVFEKNIKSYVNYNFFLFYGPNFGKVHEISSLLSKELDNYHGFKNIIPCDNDSILKNPNYIFNHIDSPDIFNRKKLLVFSSQNSDKLEKIFTSSPQNFTDFKMIIKMGELSKKSKIRSIFEKNPKLISVACYEDSIFECKNIIFEKLKKENLSISQNQLDFLSLTFRKNRGFLNQEIEKIILYLTVNKSISDLQLKALVSKESNYELESFIYSTVSGNINRFDKVFEGLKKNGINDITIINMLVKHFFKILYSKEKFLTSGSYAQSIKSIYPPIFFKFELEFIKQVKIWPKKKIELILGKLLEAENKIKNNSKKSEYLTKFLLFSITKISKQLNQVSST